MAARGLIVQHAEQPLVQIREWVTKRLKHLMGFDDVDGVVDYLMNLQSAEETEKYIKDILGTDRKAVQKFTEDLIQKRKDASPLFRTVAIRKPSAGPQPGPETGSGMKVYRKKETEADPYMVKKKKQPSSKPKDQTQSNSTGQTGSQGKKKGAKGAKQNAENLQIPGRTWCGCMAARHPLLGNCLWCGKIVCAQEGMGPCLFCGNNVGEAPGAGGTSLSADAYDASLARALEHKDKLLEYERSSARRTVIYDDQQDYFQTDGSQWLTPEQRKQLKKLEEEREKQRKEARNKVSISFDFAGRRIMVEEGEEDKDAFFFEKADEIARTSVLQNPTLRRPAPIFTAVEDRERTSGAKSDASSSDKGKIKDTHKSKTTSAASSGEGTKEKSDDEYNQKIQQRASKRVQHDYYAVDSEWMPEDASPSTVKTSSSSSASASGTSQSQRSFKFRGLCEREYDYSGLYPSAKFNSWSVDDRRKVISTLKGINGGLTSYLYVADATVPNALSLSKDNELDRIDRIAELCAKEGVDFVYGMCFPAAFFMAAQEKDKLREQLHKLKIVDRICALMNRNSRCTRYAFFFDDSPALHLPSTTAPTGLTPGGKTSLLSSLHSYVANHLVEETLRRVKQTQHGGLKFYLLPLFYGKELREARSAASKQGPSFGNQQKKEQEPEMDRDVVQYWKEMDRNARSEFTFFFSSFTSTEPRTKDSPQHSTAGRPDGSVLSKLKQLVQQHRVILLDTFPSIIPTFKATSRTTATRSTATTAVQSFPAIPYLQGYEGSKFAAAAEWAEGMAMQVAPALWPPHAALIPLTTAFDFLLSPYSHDPSIALKSALLRLLQGDERLADDLMSLIEATPSSSSSSSLAIRKFKLKKLASPTFFQETADRLSYVRKSLVSLPLDAEIQPFFVLLDAFLEVNSANFEVEAFFEKQKEDAGNSSSKKWDGFNEVKRRLTAAERKLDELLVPVRPIADLKLNLRELNTSYLTH